MSDYAPDSMLEQEYEDRNGCAYTEEETVPPNGSEEVRCPVCGDRECDGECDHGPEQEGDESMDGDHESALASVYGELDPPESIDSCGEW